MFFQAVSILYFTSRPTTVYWISTWLPSCDSDIQTKANTFTRTQTYQTDGHMTTLSNTSLTVAKSNSSVWWSHDHIVQLSHWQSHDSKVQPAGWQSCDHKTQYKRLVVMWPTNKTNRTVKNLGWYGIQLQVLQFSISSLRKGYLRINFLTSSHCSRVGLLDLAVTTDRYQFKRPSV